VCIYIVGVQVDIDIVGVGSLVGRMFHPRLVNHFLRAA